MVQLEEKLVQYLEAFESAVVGLGPQALDLALAYARIQSIGYLGIGLLFLIAALVLFRVAWVSCQASDTFGDSYHSDPEESIMVLSFLAGAGCLIPAAVNLLYIWNWAGAFYPELRLVHHAIQSLGG